MKQYIDRSSNYDKYPVVPVPGKHTVWTGWDNIRKEISNQLAGIRKIKNTGGKMLPGHAG